ncbi:MAG: polyisoprenoid-binding protein [Elusimicrobia bacterium]|nr:polyisoprenoid-binding protein [Elusimicrobiota bacterium]
MKKLVLSLLGLVWAGGAVAADTYTLDAAHSTVGFSVRHLGVSNVKGTFPSVSGTLKLDEENIAKSSVDITIEATAIDTNNAKRDDHLRNEDFFDVAKFPVITFKSKGVSKSGPGYLLVGNLTMKGVTKTVSIPFTLSGPKEHPMMPVYVVGGEGSLVINRRDFNITYGMDALVSDAVSIDLQVEFTRSKSK